MSPEVKTTVIFGVLMALLAILALLQGMKRRQRCRGTYLRHSTHSKDQWILIDGIRRRRESGHCSLEP